MSVKLPIKNSKELYEVNPQKIIALGLNYHAHIQESLSIKVKGLNPDIPKEPVLFSKTPNVLTGPEEPIIIPSFLKEYDFNELRTDYEAELAFFIKQRCKDVPAKNAFDFIYGFTCLNDVSQRNLQNSDKSGWFRGKSLDSFGPIGPCVVLTEDIGDAQNLDIKCRLNGKVVQDSNTSHMIFKIPDIIAFISKNFTLEKGDIITTGTPAGVGAIRDGDVVEVEIENIGILKNPVREEN
jgi:2-keto-4-pentenoate hydratase/2-oxohepta-3-ene-1,7-dioic acid hydratase in catechol pathway